MAKKNSGSLDTPANTREEFGPGGLHGSIFGATLVSSIMCIERSTFLVLVASVYLADGKNAHCMLNHIFSTICRGFERRDLLKIYNF